MKKQCKSLAGTFKKSENKKEGSEMKRIWGSMADNFSSEFGQEEQG